MKAFEKGGGLWSSQEIEIAMLNRNKPILELTQLLPNRSINGIKLKLHKMGVNREYRIQPRQFDFTEFELGALVGLLEGEGSLGLLKHKSRVCKKGRYLRTYTYIRPYIGISNTDSEILNFVKTRVGYGSMTGKRPSHPAWNYVISGQATISSLLTILLPFMITSRKRRLAVLVKGFCDRRLEIRRAGRGALYAQKDWDAYEEARRLNRKGPRKLKTTSVDAVAQQEGCALQSLLDCRSPTWLSRTSG